MPSLPRTPVLPLIASAVLLLGSISPARGAWMTYGGNAQHTATAEVATQPLQRIHWQVPVDLAPQYSGDILYIHYGSPLVTPGNSVIFPVKTGASDGFRLEARRAVDGSILWQFNSDYTLPPHNWTPSVGPTLTAAGRVYMPAAGGTLLWVDALDYEGAHTTTRVAFFGNAAYLANTAAFNNSLKICTPLTSDSDGTVYFGVRAVASNPLGIPNAIAAVEADGTGRWVTVTAASAGANAEVAQNCAPALSADERTLYIVTRGGSGAGRLLALSTTSLLPVHFAPLNDPLSLSAGNISNNGTSSPLVGPDGHVFYGILENPFGSNSLRGWLTQFDSTLVSSGAPGAFGWDITPSIVPRSSVSSYAGSSPYLLMCKYNYYAGIGSGDGVNRIAILDPRASQPDTRSPATVMKEVITIAGATPDSSQFPFYPNAVREWCINTALVDTFTKSVVAGAEDGILYRWDLTTNSYNESIVLTPGIGEAYTPTVSGPDGQVYAINNATLFAVGRLAVAGVPPRDDLPDRGPSLAAIRPNPTRGAARLDFRLTRESAVTLSIVDVRGRLVRRLVDGVRGAGEQSVAWDGRDDSGRPVAAGIYIARLEAQGSVRTNRLVVTR